MRDEAKGEKARGKQYQMVQMRGENGGGLNRDKSGRDRKSGEIMTGEEARKDKRRGYRRGAGCVEETKRK